MLDRFEVKNEQSFQDITFPSVYICNNNFIRWSFLLPIVGTGTNSSLMLKTFSDEFMRGPDNQTSPAAVAKLEKDLKDTYNWTNDVPASWLASQDCSDLILSASK